MANNRNYLGGSAGNLISSLTQVWDSTGLAYNTNDNSLLATGIWRPLAPSDFGGGGVASSVNITNTAPLPVSGVVVTAAATSSSAPGTTVSGINNVGFGTPLPSNAARKAWYIQNLATGALMVKYGSTLPTTGNLNILLKGSTNPYIGDGASWTDSPAVWTGPVSVSGAGGAPIVFTCWEL